VAPESLNEKTPNTAAAEQSLIMTGVPFASVSAVFLLTVMSAVVLAMPAFVVISGRPGTTVRTATMSLPSRGESMLASRSGTQVPDLDASIDSPRDGSDIVAVRTVVPGRPLMTTNAGMASTTADITVSKNTADTLANGTPVMISDCSAAAVFGVSTFTDSGATATLVHTAGGAATGVGPGNDSADVG